MSTVREIQSAIAALPAAQRAELEAWLRRRGVPAAQPVRLPDQSARRRRIFGGAVLPNAVLAQREAEVR